MIFEIYEEGEGSGRSAVFLFFFSPSLSPPNKCLLCASVFSGMNLPKPLEPQQSWAEFSAVPSSIWDIPTNDPLHSWPSSSGSPTVPTAVRSLRTHLSFFFSFFFFQKNAS